MTKLVRNLQTYEIGLGLMGKGGKSRNLALKGIGKRLRTLKMKMKVKIKMKMMMRMRI